MARPRLGPDTLDLLNLVHGRPETLAVDCTSDGSPWTPSSASLIVYRSTAPDTPVATITAVVTTGTATFDLADVTDLAVGSYTGELVVNGGSAAKGMIEVRAKGDGRGRTSGTRTVSLTLVDGATTITLDIAAVPSAGGGGGGGATNLAYVSGATSGTVTSDTGTDATIPAATGSIAGLMVPAQFTALAALSSTYQPLDSDLTAIAALTTTAFGRGLLTLANAAALRSSAGLGTAAVLDSGTGATNLPTKADVDTLISTAVGDLLSVYQPLDSDLTAIAALSTTTYGRAFLALADAAAGRSALALGGAATLNVGTTTGTVAAGDDSRLSNARTPTAHATTHQSGGADAIKLDDLATPDDNTDLDATTARHGLLPKLGGGTTNFLRADGTWAAPAGGGGGAPPQTIIYPATNVFYPPIGVSANLQSTSVSTAQVCSWFPFYTDRPLPIAEIVTFCWTAEAGSTLRVGVYSANSNATVNALLADYGTVSGATTGNKIATGTQVVTGLYFIAAWASNHASVRWSRAVTVNQAYYGEQAIAGGRQQTSWFLSGVDYSAGLPATPSPNLTWITNVQMPMCLVRYS